MSALSESEKLLLSILRSHEGVFFPRDSHSFSDENRLKLLDRGLIVRVERGEEFGWLLTDMGRTLLRHAEAGPFAHQSEGWGPAHFYLDFPGGSPSDRNYRWCSRCGTLQVQNPYPDPDEWLAVGDATPKGEEPPCR